MSGYTGVVDSTSSERNGRPLISRRPTWSSSEAVKYIRAVRPASDRFDGPLWAVMVHSGLLRRVAIWSVSSSGGVAR